jgi:hypothetical protein
MANTIKGRENRLANSKYLTWVDKLRSGFQPRGTQEQYLIDKEAENKAKAEAEAKELALRKKRKTEE